MFNFNHFCKYVHVWINGMSVKNVCNETLSKTNFPLGRIKVHLILSYLITILWSGYLENIPILHLTSLLLQETGSQLRSRKE